MKICVPTLDNTGLNGAVSSHFGQASSFTVVDSETNDVEVFANNGQHHGGGKTPAQIIIEHGAHTVLVSGLGMRAIQLFSQAGIDVFMGANGTVAESIQAFQEGRLSPATEDAACREHGNHHGGGGGHVCT